MNEENNRILPSSDLDLNLMLTDSVWGRDEINPALQNKLTKSFLVQDGENKEIIKENLWSRLAFLTRDLRLANLDPWDELPFVRYYIDLASDLLESDMIDPAIICMQRSASILETSQSKRGFLRKQMNTLRQESFNQQLEPPKKSFFGGRKVNERGGY